jgi:NodT family efflux transporter outer membrane factor (OMF) lipoprotein
MMCVLGCAVGPDFVRPQPPAVEQYTREPQRAATVEADGQSQRFDTGTGVASDWWRFFDSSRLDDLMREALASNQSLQAAQARLRQSEENLRAGHGVFYPQVNGSFDAARRKTSEFQIAGVPGGGIFNLYTLAGTIGYALDVFGGNRRAVESLQAQTDFHRYAVGGTYLALSGNIVNTVVAAAAYRALIKSTGEIVEAEKEQIRITEAQAEAGLVPYANVLSIRTQMFATEATIPQLQQKVAQTEHLLAALTGRTPAESAPLQIALTDLKLPSEVPVTLPSDLVRQRPDILMAEAQLHGASADIGVATAALFPSFTLNGTYGVNNTSMGNLFNASGSFWALGANVAAPLFQGGSLWFKRKAAIEAYNQALATYRQTVLDAFAQVADVLRALEHDAEALKSQSHALAAAEEALRLIQANYEAGLANYVQVLVANAQYHQAQIGYLQAVAQRLQDTAALFVALGGGWWQAHE